MFQWVIPIDSYNVYAISIVETRISQDSDTVQNLISVMLGGSCANIVWFLDHWFVHLCQF